MALEYHYQLNFMQTKQDASYTSLYIILYYTIKIFFLNFAGAVAPQLTIYFNVLQLSMSLIPSVQCHAILIVLLLIPVPSALLLMLSYCQKKSTIPCRCCTLKAFHQLKERHF